MDQELRRRARLSLWYHLQLRRVEGQVSLEAETDNISGSGFYCIASEPFSPGEYLECKIGHPGPVTTTHPTQADQGNSRGNQGPGTGIRCCLRVHRTGGRESCRRWQRATPRCRDPLGDNGATVRLVLFAPGDRRICGIRLSAKLTASASASGASGSMTRTIDSANNGSVDLRFTPPVECAHTY